MHYLSSSHLIFRKFRGWSLLDDQRSLNIKLLNSDSVRCGLIRLHHSMAYDTSRKDAKNIRFCVDHWIFLKVYFNFEFHSVVLSQNFCSSISLFIVFSRLKSWERGIGGPPSLFPPPPSSSLAITTCVDTVHSFIVYYYRSVYCILAVSGFIRSSLEILNFGM